ncbi:MAG: hypothetical protein OEZ01_08070, partial [Candidatus Heimdallarchaeota archaeon]|nr:hypothetical protein [Candidatus Heimdallarchaeota archaeon]
MMREIKGEPEDTNIYYSTGLPSLDRRFGTDSQDHSGIPGGSLVLIHLPPESNLGSLFAQKVVMNLLETYEGGRTYYMHSSRPQHIVLKEFNAYGWDISKFQQEKRWEFIDMWHITSSHVASSSKIGKIDIRRKAYLKQAFQRMLKVHQT